MMHTQSPDRRMQRHARWLSLPALVFAACAATHPQDSRALEESRALNVRLFPTPHEGIRVPGSADKHPFTCKQLLAELERVTGAHFLVDLDQPSLLERTPVGLVQPLDIPPDRVWNVVESLLLAHDFTFRSLTDRDPIVLSVKSLSDRGGGNDSPKSSAAYVPVEALAAWCEHPGLIVTTIIDLDFLNVRDLSNSMRQMFTDPNSQQIIPIGNTNSLMLTGFAPRVAELANVLLMCNAHARDRIEREERLSPEQREKRNGMRGIAGP